MIKLIAALSLLFSLNSWAKLKLTMFPVWHGDLILIELPHGENILLDTGRESMYNKYIKPYLQKNNLKIDYLVLTHPHGDHIEGAAQIIREQDLLEVWDNGHVVPGKAPWDKYQKALQERSTLTYQPKRYEIRHLGEVKFEFFNPPITKNSWNNRSLMFMMTHGKIKFLFTGDAEKEAQREILNIYKDRLKADVYKIPHHGLKDAFVKEFMNAVNPKFFICPCLPGKPNKTQKKHIKKMEGTLLNVKELGTITLESDGKIVNGA